MDLTTKATHMRFVLCVAALTRLSRFTKRSSVVFALPASPPCGRSRRKPWLARFAKSTGHPKALESSRLAALAAGHGRFFDGHRALPDCEAALDVLSRPLTRSGRTAPSALLHSARRPRWRVSDGTGTVRLTRAPKAPRVGGSQWRSARRLVQGTSVPRNQRPFNTIARRWLALF